MVLKYKGTPPFKVPVQTVVADTPLAVASERTLHTVSANVYAVYNASGADELVEIRSYSNNPDAIDLVSWYDEGLDNPNNGSKYVYKVTVPAGGKVIISIPYKSVKPATSRTIVYIRDSGCVARVNLSSRSFNDTALNNGVNVTQTDVTGAYQSLSVPVFSTFGEIDFLNVVLDNSGGSSYAVVYIAYIVISYVNMYVYKPDVAIGHIITTDTAVAVYYNVVVPPDSVYELWFAIGLTSDGTNTVSCSIQILTDLGYVTLSTVSTTSSTRVSFARPYVIKLEGRNGRWYVCRIKLTFSNTAGISAEWDWLIELHVMGTSRRVQNIYDEGSITVAASTSSSSPIIDFTSSPYYADIAYLEISSDSNALTVYAEDEYGNKLTPDIAGETYTLPVELKEVRKITLVYDNTATTSQTVTYKVIYRKYDGILIR